MVYSFMYLRLRPCEIFIFMCNAPTMLQNPPQLVHLRVHHPYLQTIMAEPEMNKIVTFASLILYGIRERAVH